MCCKPLDRKFHCVQWYVSTLVETKWSWWKLQKTNGHFTKSFILFYPIEERKVISYKFDRVVVSCGINFVTISRVVLEILAFEWCYSRARPCHSKWNNDLLSKLRFAHNNRVIKSVCMLACCYIYFPVLAYHVSL